MQTSLANTSVQPRATTILRSLLDSRGALPILFGGCALVYIYAFVAGLSPYWFNPNWTTDDALQQLYPFHKALHPGLFQGDIVTLMMESYLAPIHYWLSYGITLLTKDPVMMGHWMMLLQVIGASTFVFLAVRYAAGTPAAFFALTWLFHTRHVMQRLTGGLPRGWSALVLSAFLYFVIRGRQSAVLLTLLVGCFLHTPATLVCALSYGLLLIYKGFFGAEKQIYRQQLKRYLILSPLFVIAAWSVVRMPAEIGTMASYDQALELPEFQRPKGRFPFAPLNPAMQEIRAFGFQAFIGRFYNPGGTMRAVTPLVAVLILFAGLMWARHKRRNAPTAELLTFGLAIFIVYFASRILAFKLYVPDRHLQFPMAIFFIVSFPILLWRAFSKNCSGGNYWPFKSSLRDNGYASVALIALAGFVYLGSGTGLYGAANFNFSRNKRGLAFEWIAANTPQNALFAGNPTHIDPLPLFSGRQAFMTTEAAHPFYDKYRLEVRRRLEIELRANYAATLAELVEIVEPQGIDYFVFRREDFYPDALKQASYFPPFDDLVRKLSARDPNDFAFRKLPPKVDMQRYPFMPYKDEQSIVVDIAALKRYLVATS